MKILVVEDDYSIRNILEKSLRNESYTVETAEDGEKAVYLSKINEYDLMILDIVLPKKDGLSVCEELRSLEIDTPILMLSSKNDVLTKIKLLKSGADDYLTKPFSFQELLARIQAIARRPKNIQTSTLKNGSITLNSDTHELYKNDKKIYLTKKEIGLLELLMKNQNKVISRGMIMEHVWESDSNPFSNTIEAHILSLRKKLGDKRKNLICSIPGRGYKMVNFKKQLKSKSSISA